MTSPLNYDKKKLTILRAVLILVGAGVGAAAVWQYFVVFPELVRKEYRIVITVVSAAVLAAILGLSAKPMYRLGVSIAELFSAVLGRLGARGILGVLLGLATASLATYAIDIAVRLTQDIWAIRLLIDVLIFLGFAALCCYGFTAWLSAPSEGEAAPTPKIGYLLSAAALADERSLTAVNVLINVNVTDAAYKALSISGADTAAAERLGKLLSSGAVGLVHCRSDFSTPEEYAAVEAALAERKRLRLVSAAGAVGKDSDDALNISFFAPPNVERVD